MASSLRFARLLQTIEQLGIPTGTVDDVDIDRLAAMFAGRIDAERISLLEALFRHANPFARLVAVRAASRMQAFENRPVLEGVVACIEDASPIVRCAAALAIATSGYRTPRVIEALRRAADGTTPRDTVDADDPAQRARVEAAGALARLTGA